MSQRKSIIVLDDEEDVLDICKRVLGDDYIVEHFTSSKRAFNRIMQGSFNLLLSDINIPGTNISELLNAVLLAKPGIKIVLMTGFVIDDGKLDMIHSRISGYIVKPFSFKDLKEKISNVLAR